MADYTRFGKLGKYELLEKIGEGGFGIVYKARDPLLEREVAIKILRADIASAPDFVERFRREARLAASLRHPNIVSVIEVGEQEGRYYLVMEYLEGQVLSEQLRDGKPLPLHQAVEILRPLAEALDYAHGRGLVHRDVKPSNVILCDGGKRPVLTDFGLVKSTSESGLTTTGVSLGTVEYMAPEQILGQEPGPAADQYALGVVAYQMFTGQVPFPGKTPFEIQSGHVNQQPPDPCKLNPAFPTALSTVLMKALAKNPAERFTNGCEFVTAMGNETKKLSAEQAMILYKEAQEAYYALDFESAIIKLEQAQLIHPLPEISGQLQEYRIRQQVWDEYVKLHAQKKQIEARLADIDRANAWLAASNKAEKPQTPEKTTLQIANMTTTPVPQESDRTSAPVIDPLQTIENVDSTPKTKKASLPLIVLGIGLMLLGLYIYTTVSFLGIMPFILGIWFVFFGIVNKRTKA